MNNNLVSKIKLECLLLIFIYTNSKFVVNCNIEDFEKFLGDDKNYRKRTKKSNKRKKQKQTNKQTDKNAAS